MRSLIAARTIGPAFLALSACGGCSPDPLQKVPVRGVVTFDGQACPAPGRVTFSPIEAREGMPKRPAAGAFEVDGRYSAMSFRPDDGLVPGRYQVAVTCVDATKISNPPTDASYARASYVDPSFQPDELVVEPGSRPIELNLDVPTRKPN